jgi:site-specific DNA-methyltransferase (adenine-specific)
MSTQSRFSLRGRNPDVLTCIANLSNDEVFTPPELANRMLDTLADAWAASHGGASIWADPTVRFLDPCTKSGVFLREITRRLNAGLATQIPDLEKRVEHILTKQVFGIAITQLTSLLARRSLYCSKFANGKHSVARSFKTPAGNIWFERMEHDWVNGKCSYCGAGQTPLDRGGELESHAYAFIHTDDIAARMGELFGENMQFDVIIGNPPYQLADDGHGSSASTIYHRFVEQAFQLDPRYAIFVTPSRWFAGGKGLDAYRDAMLTSRKIRRLVDYPNAADVFPSVDVKGGVSYFLWDREQTGNCEFTLVRGNEAIGPVSRSLDEHDVLVRDIRGLRILRKVLKFGGSPLSELVSARWAFGTELTSNFSKWERSKPAGGRRLRLYMQGGDRDRWVDPQYVTRNAELIDEWKVLLPKAGPGNSGGHSIPDIVLGRPIIAEPGSVCTLTYLVGGPLPSESACESLAAYLRTRFSRFLVSLRKPSQDAPRGVYAWVPQQTWDRDWMDEELYERYGLTKDEISFIESMIRPMDSDDD